MNTTTYVQVLQPGVYSQMDTIVSFEALHNISMSRGGPAASLGCQEAPVYRLLQCCTAGKQYLTWLTNDVQA